MHRTTVEVGDTIAAHAEAGDTYVFSGTDDPDFGLNQHQGLTLADDAFVWECQQLLREGTYDVVFYYEASADHEAILDDLARRATRSRASRDERGAYPQRGPSPPMNDADAEVDLDECDRAILNGVPGRVSGRSSDRSNPLPGAPRTRDRRLGERPRRAGSTARRRGHPLALRRAHRRRGHRRHRDPRGDARRRRQFRRSRRPSERPPRGRPQLRARTPPTSTCGSWSRWPTTEERGRAGTRRDRGRNGRADLQPPEGARVPGRGEVPA